MRVEDLTDDQKNHLLQTLINGSRLSSEEIASIVLAVPSDDLKSIAEVLHNLLCEINHNYESLGPARCPFYEEDNWSGAAHKEWMQRSIELAKLLQEPNLGRMLGYIRESVDKMSDIFEDPFLHAVFDYLYPRVSSISAVNRALEAPGSTS